MYQRFLWMNIALWLGLLTIATGNTLSSIPAPLSRSFNLSLLSGGDVNKLRNGGDFSIQFIDGTYVITGAFQDRGTLGSSDPTCFSFAELGSGTGLDVQFNLQDLLPFLNIDLVVQFHARILGSDKVEWTLDVSPNECIPVEIDNNRINFLITRIQAKLTAELTPLDCQNEPNEPPCLTRKVTLRLDPADGNAGNFLNAEGYLLCINNQSFFTQARIENLQWVGYGGGLPKASGNVNDDCAIDNGDLNQVLTDFGTNNAASDVNHDGRVDDKDLVPPLRNNGMSG